MELNIHTQPDDETCGPTSLHAVYDYYSDGITLDQVVEQVELIDTGGTIASLLGCHALQRGYDVELFVYNVQFFDPSWFNPPLSMPDLSNKLREQMAVKEGGRFASSSLGYLRFLQMGGVLRFRDLTPGLLAEYLRQNIPIITGLSATYLYRTAREIYVNKTCYHDDVQGFPSGHFVVLCDIDLEQQTVTVADPHLENPISNDNYYVVDTMRLINAIMLGVLTYDANLLVLKPNGKT